VEWSNTKIHVNWCWQVEGTAGFSKKKKEKNMIAENINLHDIRNM
jgi:hypothetical protein